jgi:hypothetical protein
MSVSIVPIRIVGHTLPGRIFCEHAHVHIGVQRASREEVLDPVSGDAPQAVFTFSITAVRGEDGQLDFRGLFVQGRRDARFIYLSWGDLLPDGQFRMFRRAKLPLSALTETGIADRLASGMMLEAVVNLTGRRGGPICALVRPPDIRWRIVRET